MDIINRAKSQGRTTLTEAEAKEVLKKYGVPVVEEKIVKSIEEAESIAEKIRLSACFKRLRCSSHT